MEQRINELAAQMGVTPSDVRGFVDCLALWMRKGYTLEQAIERHMQQMTRLVNNAVQLSHTTSIRTATSAQVWEAVNA